MKALLIIACLTAAPAAIADSPISAEIEGVVGSHGHCFFDVRKARAALRKECAKLEAPLSSSSELGVRIEKQEKDSCLIEVTSFCDA